jgi:hypothetical protein
VPSWTGLSPRQYQHPSSFGPVVGRARLDNVENMSPAVKVVYIAGFPRSGSTLLERLLGAEADVFCAGELRRIWERGFIANELCSCGEPFASCPFWDEVVEVAFGGPEGVDAEAIAAVITSLDTRGNRWEEIARRTLTRRISRPTLLGEVLPQLYRAIASVSGRPAIVDSSKDSTYGLILSTMADIETDVIHIVRDSRAVAYSWQRRRRRPEVVDRTEYMPLIRPGGTALGWTIRNVSTEALRGFSQRYARVQYESLVTDPAAVLRQILLDAPCAAPTRDNPSKSAVRYHTVSGNPMRLEQGPLTVTADLEWKAAMNARDWMTVTALTSPLLLRYGYDLLSGRRKLKPVQ